MKTYCVYMLCNRRNGTLYVGVTSDLPRRIYEDKNNLAKDLHRNMACTVSCGTKRMRCLIRQQKEKSR